MTMRKKAAALMLIGCGNSHGDQAYASASVSAEETTLTYQSDFRSDKAAWSAKYKGKKVVIAGPVASVHADDGLVVLKAGEAGTVSAAGVPREQSANLKQGDSVRLQCRGVDSGLQATLDKCSVLK
jgi:ribosomal protein S1